MPISRKQLMREAVSHQKVLTCFAYTLLRDWSLAEDAVQDALVVASTSDLAEIRNIKGWLKRITYNKSMDILRKRQREISYHNKELFVILEKKFTPLMEDSHLEEFNLKRKLLKTCMEYLNKNTHDIVTKFYTGMSCDILAKRYNRSVNSIWLVISRARKNLRKCVKKQLNNGVSQ